MPKENEPMATRVAGLDNPSRQLEVTLQDAAKCATPVITIGVIGYGYWGPNLVRNFAEVPGGRVGFVTDIRDARGSQVRTRYPAAKVSTGYRDSINDPSVDAVAIATPVSSHFELAMAALRAGK